MRCAGSLLLLLVSCALVSLAGCSLLVQHEPTTVQVSLLGPLSHKDVSEAEKLLCSAEGLVDLGHIDKAELRLTQAIRLNPALGPAHNNLGLILYERRELYEAAHAFQRAMELMPGDPLPQHNLAMTLEKGERLDQAIFHYERAHELEPDNPIFLGNLLRARLARGDLTDDVVDMLQDLIFLDTRPDWVEWAQDELAIMLPKARRAAERERESLQPNEPEPQKSDKPTERSEEPFEDGPQLELLPPTPISKPMNNTPDLDAPLKGVLPSDILFTP